MPATVDNNTLLEAFNQTIQALLDLATSISSNSNGCPDVTVNVPASEPVINVYNTVKCGGCGSGGSGSIGSGSPVDSDPVDGYVPGNDPVIDAAKCKRVNYVIDKYLDFLGLWGAVEGLLAIGPAEALAAYLLGSGSLVFSSILVAGALITLFWSVVTLFTGGLVIFSYIVAHAVDVRANREELTCAMYNAATPGDMRQAIIDFMSNHLAGLPQAFVTYHIDTIFSNNVLNGIFNGWTDTGVIAELDAYTSPGDCGGCDDDSEGYTWDFSINSKGGTNTGQNAFIVSTNGIANSYDGGGHWWGSYGPWTTMKLYPGKDLVMPQGTIVKIWWENAEGSAQGNLEQYQVSQAYGYFPGQAYGGTSPSEVAINRDWATPEIFLTPTLGALRITKIVIVGVH